MQMIFAVAAGAAFGAVARYLVVTGVGRLLGPHDFPWSSFWFARKPPKAGRCR